MYNEGILNTFNHFKLVNYMYVLRDNNENEMNQIHMTGNIN